ncbi:hypothetical protein AVEN_4499-1 [Araneus ventricosus]|uniref:Uncharacterized protein n=1 Tax=Araneus ventricosus TaxID=182803 RepID=A0A4Y2BNE8_ARAVE|nr:hypothetical protein AVEN_4499-1 [Araneus ventricosus]
MKKLTCTLLGDRVVFLKEGHLRFSSYPLGNGKTRPVTIATGPRLSRSPLSLPHMNSKRCLVALYALLKSRYEGSPEQQSFGWGNGKIDFACVNVYIHDLRFSSAVTNFVKER